MKYEPNQTFNLKDGSQLKIVEVYSDSIDAVLVTPIGDYIEYVDVSPATINAIINRRH